MASWPRRSDAVGSLEVFESYMRYSSDETSAMPVLLIGAPLDEQGDSDKDIQNFYYKHVLAHVLSYVVLFCSVRYVDKCSNMSRNHC